MKEILIRSGKYGTFKALVDDEDYERMAQHRWNICKRKNHIRVQRSWITDTGKHKTVFLHREIMQPERGEEIDHKNRNGLDNRRENLRIVEHKHNSRNVEKYNNKKSSQYKGVFRHNNKWQAIIRVDYNAIYLGSFNSEIEAAKIYNEASEEYHGEYGRKNVV